MCMTDYDPPSLYISELRTARKQHKCGECYRPIMSGERYQHVRGVWNGEPETHKTCQHCLVGQNLLMDECGGFLHGGIDEDLAEHIHELLPWSMKAARLVVGMRREWLRFDGKGLMEVQS